MKQYGLIGYRLDYSFSKGYFTKKFENEGIEGSAYDNYPIDTIDGFMDVVNSNPNLVGLNVTIPYKQQVMQFMDEIAPEAEAIGAVNTVKFIRQDDKLKLVGYNSDVYGFEMSLKPMLQEKHKKALILGTGGASKAIKYVLKKLGLSYLSASIDELKDNEIRYQDINAELLSEYLVIINATPLGTFPDVDDCPNIPYEHLTPDHVLFDLVYNPEETKFLRLGRAQGAQGKNGLEMLHGQAEGSYAIWNS